MYRYALGALMCCLMWFGSLAMAQQTEPANLVVNGNFENAVTGWHWEEWKGYKLPGFVDRDDMNEGAASFKITVPDLHERRQMGMSINGIVPGKDYTLKIDLMCSDLAKDGAVVRLLMFTKDAGDEKSKPGGWIQIPAGSGVNELIKLTGTQAWKTYTVQIPQKAISANISHVWIMIDHKDVGTGVVGVDNIRLYEKQDEPVEKPQAKLPTNTTYTYDIADPTVIIPVENAKLRLTLEPEQTLYRVGNLPKITLDSQAIANATLTLQIKNGFGDVVFEKVSLSLNQALRSEVKLPDEQGYFEIIATAKRDGKDFAQTRRAIGILSPPPATDTDEPWGLWCNGRSDFEELGVRWTRPALYWYYYNKDAKDYMAKTIKMIDENHAKSIKVLMYPKDHPSHHAITQKVFKDTPEAWAEVRDYWTFLVKSLAGKVDAWGLINEPYRGMWAGTDDLIIRYWAMMHDIVKQHDPDTPVIGPSLNVNEPSMMAQYSELLDMGLGKHIDGLELHTYTATAMPEDINWENNIRQVRKLTEKAAGPLPVYSTEMGMSMGYDGELYQAQYLSRCFLWAKRMNLKMLLWHMYSWPDGTPLSERDFAIFRGDPKKVQLSQPRPAGVVYGVMTRQLSGTTYRTELDYLSPSVKAFVFERDGDAMLAIWRIDTRTTTVDLAISGTQPTVTDMFGNTQTLPVHDGLITLTVGPSPQFLTGIGKDYLQSKPLIQTPPTLALQAGSQGQSQLHITNPTDQPATVTLQWLTSDTWQVKGGEQPIALSPNQTVTLPVSVTSPVNAAYGQSVIYARAKLNGKMVTPARLPVLVQPRVQIAHVKPTLDAKTFSPAITLELERLDPTLKQINVMVGQQQRMVSLDQEHVTATLLVDGDTNAARLQDYPITISDSWRQQDQRDCALSFVPTLKVTTPPIIDGDLSDWQGLTTPVAGKPTVAWRWDQEHLYLAVMAVDVMHVQDERPETLWSQDSIQIGLSAFESQDWLRKPIGEMRESDRLEIAVGAAKSGKATAYCHATMNRQTCPMGEVSNSIMPAAVRAENGVTTYELAIPCSMIGFKPLAGGRIVRASVLLNTRDDGRRGYVEWFSGIAQTKSPNLFGHLILLPSH